MPVFATNMPKTIPTLIMLLRGRGNLRSYKRCGKKRNYDQFEAWSEDKALPAYELYDRLNSVSMFTSRGCPFRCTYCASFLLEPGFTLKDPEKDVAEIERYVTKMGINDIAFYDDAFLVNPEKHIIPILELLINKRLHARYHTPNGIHPKYIKLRFARLLWKAGFRTLRFGFEGTSGSIQKASIQKASRHKVITMISKTLWIASKK